MSGLLLDLPASPSGGPSLPALSLQPLRFGPFLLDAEAARLQRDGQPLHLPPRPFALLCHLAHRPGQLVAKHALLDAVWGHRHVSESTLKGAVNIVRQRLGDDAWNPQWIETVAQRGYRFIGAPATVTGSLHWQAQPPRRPHLRALPPPVAAGRRAPNSPPDEVPLGTPSEPPSPRGSAKTLPAARRPAATAALIGRSADRAILQRLLATQPLITLVGPGGVGKTRLALDVAAALSEAGCTVDVVRLDALADGAALCGAIAQALQMAAAAGRDVQSLAQSLHCSRRLLVLDNCEHLLDSVALLVQALQSGASGVHVLATSQQPLRLPGEQLLRLAPLQCPAAYAGAAGSDAVELFVQRVRAHDPGFAPAGADLVAVGAVCRALDGLPLALELAAARVPLLGVPGIAARLAQRLDLLNQGAEAATPRQRSLRTMLQWSHGLLTPTEGVVLRRLAVFGGGFSLEAAQAVLADDALDRWAVVDALASLLDKSLLVADATADAAPERRRAGRTGRTSVAGAVAPQRLRLLNTIRSFAAEKLAAAGETQALNGRHQQWVLALLLHSQQTVHDQPPAAWTAALLPEADNLRLALRHSVQRDPPAAVALAGAAALFWQRSGLKQEALRWHVAVSAFVTPALPLALRAAHGQALGVLAVHGMLVAPAAAEPVLLEAVRLHREGGDAVGETFNLYLLSQLLLRLTRPAELAPLLLRMQALEQPDWSPLRRRYARWLAALVWRNAGNGQRYRDFCVDEITLLQQLGDDQGVWAARHALALAEHDRGQPAAAIALLDATVREVRACGQLRQQPLVVALRACMRLEHDSGRTTLEVAREAIALLRADSTLWSMALALPFAALARRQAEDAARVLGWAEALVARQGERSGPYFAGLQSRCRSRLRGLLPGPALQPLLDDGAALGDDAALGLAFGG